MTYEQAYALLKTYFGKDPAQVASSQLQSSYIPLGIPLELRANIQTAWYGANRAGIPLQQQLTNKGFITNPEAANVTAAPVNLSGSQFAQNQFQQAVTSVNPEASTLFQTVPTITVPSIPATTPTPSSVPTITVPSIPATTPTPAPAPVVLPPVTVPPATAPTTTAPKTPVNVPSPIQAGYKVISEGGTVDINTPSGVYPVPRVVELRGITYTFNEDTGNWEGLTAEGYTSFTNPTNQIGYVATPNWKPTTAAPATAGGTTTTTGGTTTGGTTTGGTTAGGTTTGTATPTPTASNVGPAGDSIAQMEYLNRLGAADALEKRAKEAYNLAVRLAGTERETGVRRAEADAYNAAMRAVAGLGARGISGMGGLKTAAQRAASSEPLQKRMDALEAYIGKTSAASLLLGEEQAKALQSRQDAQTAMLRANKIASDLAAGATGTAATTTASGQIPTISNPLAQSQTTISNLNTLPPTIQVPKIFQG